MSEAPEVHIVASKTAGGVTLNHRQAYEVSVDVADLCESALFYSGLDCIDIKPAAAKLVGVDHNYLLIVNARRMPFSFAALTVKLSDKQIAKEISLESKSGAAGVPSAASAALDAKAEREKIKLEAKEREEQAKGQ